jgi:hypothetical protein
VEANWTLPNDFTLTSISSYRFWNFTPRNDDGLNVPATYNAGVSVKTNSTRRNFAWPRPRAVLRLRARRLLLRLDLDNKSFAYYGPQADIWNGTPRGALANVSSVGNGHIRPTVSPCSPKAPGTSPSAWTSPPGCAAPMKRKAPGSPAMRRRWCGGHRRGGHRTTRTHGCLRFRRPQPVQLQPVRFAQPQLSLHR